MLDRWPVFTVRNSIWLSVLVAMLGCAIVAHSSGFHLAPASDRLAIVVALVTIGSIGVRPSRFERIKPIVEASDALLMFTIIGMLGAVASYVAMANAGSMTDALLDGGDRFLGFRWTAIRAFVDARPSLLLVLELAYFLGLAMPLPIVAILAFKGRSKRLYDFVAIHGVSLALTVVMAFFFPARAAFDYYRYRDVPENGRHYGAIIEGLRSHTLREINLADLGGIITFPSFHATLAVLFIWSLWPFRFLRVPVLLLNISMWAAAVPVGGHYVIDLFGGTMVAIIAIFAIRGREMCRSTEADWFVRLGPSTIA